MHTNPIVGDGDSDDSTWRPPTVGYGKILWFITPKEFDHFQAGELSKTELQDRAEARKNGERPFPDYYKEGGEQHG